MPTFTGGDEIGTAGSYPAEVKADHGSRVAGTRQRGLSSSRGGGGGRHD